MLWTADRTKGTRDLASVRRGRAGFLHLILKTFEPWFPGASLVAQMVKNPPALQKTRLQSLSWEDPLEKGNGYPLQYSCLECFMDRGALQATVLGIPKSWTQLSDQHLHFFTRALGSPGSPRRKAEHRLGA